MGRWGEDTNEHPPTTSQDLGEKTLHLFHQESSGRFLILFFRNTLHRAFSGVTILIALFLGTSLNMSWDL